MLQIRIFLHYIGSLQGHVVTVIEVCFLGPFHVGYSASNNSPDKFAKTKNVVYSMPCLRTPLQHKTTKEHCFLKKSALFVLRIEIEAGLSLIASVLQFPFSFHLTPHSY